MLQWPSSHLHTIFLQTTMHPIFTSSSSRKLLTRVARGLGPEDWANLLRISRPFFAAVAPLVWQKVEGVHNLLALLPGADIRFSRRHPKQVEYMDLSNTRPQNLVRFRFYAQFVKSLEIYGKHSGEYEVQGWRILALHAKDGTLLPNLLRLTLTAPFPITTPDQTLWIEAFLAPSTVDVLVIPPPGGNLPVVSIPAARDILTHISNVAPKIQHLSLFIEEGQSHIHPGFLEPLLSDCFRNLRALQEITSTEAILDVDVFQVVSGLPELKVLDIWVHGFTGTGGGLDPENVPLYPFPALEHFSMRGTDPNGVWAIFGCLVFSNLSSLRLGFHTCLKSEAGDAPSVYQLIELFARACPRLTALSIAFNQGRNDDDDPADLLELAPDGGTALSSMSKLPLRTVHLSNAVLGLEPNSIRPDALQIAWPLVTELSMPHLLAGFEELYEFSRLPNLQELTLGLGLEEDDLDDDFFKRPIGSSSLRTLRVFADTYLRIAPNTAAKYVHMP
ncbi:hypothetical protein FRC08_018420 [Ceratobasidium sp. 394]|nr:hypothetical protein FRC08_018420 [Ceratobasidium sp. 394]